MAVSRTKAAAIVVLILSKRIKERNQRRRIWVRSWIKRREIEDTVKKLICDLRAEDTDNEFRAFFRMSPQQFDFLLEKVDPIIRKMDTTFRKAISSETRLIVTLRYLASGDSYRSLMLLFRIPHNTISGIVAETCQAIHLVLRDYLKV